MGLAVRRPMRLVLAISVLVLSVAAPRAEACSRLALTTIRGFDVLPAEGSRVPRSTSLWLRSDMTDGTAVTELSSLRLVDERGKLVPYTTSQVRVSGERAATLFVVKPANLLDANSSFMLELGGKVLTRFSTSEEVDTHPPALPKARVSNVSAAAVATGFGCGAPSTVSVVLEMPGDVNFLVPDSSSGSSMPGTALAIANGTDLMAAALPQGQLDLRVVAFDLSGNMAVSSERLSTTVPFDGSVGCTVGLGAPTMLLALLALLRRR